MRYPQKHQAEKLFQVVHVSERFRALVTFWSRGEEPPRELVTHTPPEQADDLRRRIAIYESINIAFIEYLEVTAERLQTLKAWFMAATMQRGWGLLALLTRTYLGEFSPEPILRSTLAERRREVERELLPLEELANWSATEDYEANLRKLQEAVAAGALKAEQNGDRVLIAVGDYCRWANEDIPICPDLGPGFDVRPASERKRVERHSEHRQALIQALRASPQGLGWQEMQGLAADLQAALGIEELSGSAIQRLLQAGKEECALSEVIRQQTVTTYRHLRAMEGTIAEANEACLPDGDIAHPMMRDELMRQLDQLAELYAEAVSVLPTPPFDLPEPDEEDGSFMRHLVHMHSPDPCKEAEKECSLCQRK